MNFRDVTDTFYQTDPFYACFTRAAAGDHFTVTGVPGSLLSLLIGGLYSSLGEQFIVIAPDYSAVEQLRGDLGEITSAVPDYFPSYRGRHLEDKQINTDIRLARLKCLKNLSLGVPGIYIVDVRSLFQPIIPPEKFRNRLLNLTKGEENDLALLTAYLVEEGFSRESMVEDFGDISVRGGILDIFPLNMLEPVRIEFDGDRIESIRVFDINSQRSIREVERVVIVPPMFDTTGSLAPELPEVQNSLFGYFSGTVPLFFHQPAAAEKTLADYFARWERNDTGFEGNSPGGAGAALASVDELLATRKSAYLRSSLTAVQERNAVHFGGKSLPGFNRNLALFSRIFQEMNADYPDLTVFVLCDHEDRVNRLRDVILEENLLPVRHHVLTASLAEGFVYSRGPVAVVNDHEIFSRMRHRKPKPVYRARKVIFDELSLKVGDHVVHEDYGIGRYLGLGKINIGKGEQEALKIEYRDGDSLYLNIEKLPRLEKYTGREGYKPELSKLGGGDWERVKQRTKKSAQNIAKDLIGLYAQRASREGFTFSPDTQWQRELEVSFQYDETPDQVKACWEIKKDMELPRPMDRLVCGDVGFGKTEVAVRATFKAVNDDKQVAVLVPTTILAQQHFETFCERLSRFPLSVEMLSRFRTPKEQKTILEGLKKGSIDVVIGTHRLLSRDVSFRDLGLVIIDEEQRFGVAHKEKLKKLRSEVDVLTLTATPIPRTIHMSLLGVRDLSVINTPPKNRLPIITEIAPYNDDLVRAAILKELDRGGQIYFVHNRVQTIHKMKRRLERIVPESSYGIVHGQMKARDLEKMMMSFLRGEFSCLISTMIIESGLDIPRVNTIIVNQADHFGLAQLYQLRGRVGRSDIQAFAYLLTPPFEVMTEDSIKRLQTLSEHTELGSGLQVALKDLEIRGAGNLLGAEQSGQINDVGFDMYTRLIRDAVATQKGELGYEEEVAAEPVKKASEVSIDTDVAAYFPEKYIPDSFQRVSFYRKISTVDTAAELEAIKDEVTDRYGPIPVHADNLFKLVGIKLAGCQLSLVHIAIVNTTFSGTFEADCDAAAEKKEQLAQMVSSFVELSSYPFTLRQEKRLSLELPLNNGSDSENLSYILDFLTSLTLMRA